MPNYLDPQIAPDQERVRIKTVRASAENLEGYGKLVAGNPEEYQLEIVRWPAQGWRSVDEDSGDEGGSVHGTFVSEWRGDVLFGRNEAVDGSYILGYGKEPELSGQEHSEKPEKVLLWHCNYHPDGGQLFFPLDKKPFVVPLALPGDDVKPSDFVNFWFDGTCGLYIHPNIWHEGVFTLEGSQRFYDKQGAVHARVSIDFPREFNCLLEIDLTESI